MSHKKRPKIDSRIVPQSRIPTIRVEGGYKNLKPIWKFSRFDKAHKLWGVDSGKWDKVIEALGGYERMTWGEIECANGGRKSGSNSHFLPIDGCSPEARKRIKELKLNLDGIGEDSVFSLRITSKHRLIGVLHDDGTFYAIWNDLDHKVYTLS